MLLADDHGAIRAGLGLILGNAEGIEVIGEAADGATAVRQARAFKPDAVLVDVRMPGTEGATAAHEVIAEGLAEVLVLTTFDLDEYVHAALRAGEAGFLLKSVEAPRLIEAVKLVAAGEGVLAPQVTRKLITAFAQSAEKPATMPAGDLAGREREVLACLGAGLANAGIGARLRIGETAVKTHVSRVLAKLVLRSRVQVTILAQETGVPVSDGRTVLRAKP
ncbi:response regulator transcription factor [Amycolatopsis sp. FDAARGOS 1241]|uniref:response regulator n=1 Tax=Amycolatopsis sp. FDAARGOS 1241 TaxID=2778070 RepID=UPI00194E33DE|nr:response regulator transcription factor [Amycolatopsis sp. FDAARGOS 1241]QRP43933.1 response regulator transcription factor [Amycolatopsis sp. FDAARGOS 1241]